MSKIKVNRKGLPRELKRRWCFTSKFRLESSSGNLLSDMSVGFLLMSILIECSKGKLKMWNVMLSATNIF